MRVLGTQEPKTLNPLNHGIWYLKPLCLSPWTPSKRLEVPMVHFATPKFNGCRNIRYNQRGPRVLRTTHMVYTWAAKKL